MANALSELETRGRDQRYIVGWFLPCGGGMRMMVNKSAERGLPPPDVKSNTADNFDRGRLKIKQLAKEKGLTLQDLSRAVGMNGTYMQQHCSVEKRQPWVLPEDILQKVAQILEVSADEIRTPYRQRRRPSEERKAATALQLAAPMPFKGSAAAASVSPSLPSVRNTSAPQPEGQCSLDLPVSHAKAVAIRGLRRGDLVVARALQDGDSERLELRKVEGGDLGRLLEELQGAFVLKVMAEVA